MLGAWPRVLIYIISIHLIPSIVHRLNREASLTNLRSDRAHLRRSRARFSSVLHALFALFGTISASLIAAIEQVRHLAEGLLKLAP